MRVPVLIATCAATLTVACGQPAANPSPAATPAAKATAATAETASPVAKAGSPAASPAASPARVPSPAPSVSPAADPMAEANPYARFTLVDGQGASVALAQLTQVGPEVRVELQSRGLPPGVHGVHLHAVARCDVPDFASAGPHFNPDNRQHGTQNPQGPHAGDLPNLEVNPAGRGSMETATDRVSLTAGPNSLLDADGSALVIHAQADDERTDPSGNSGDRIACGIVALD